jgi:hypothetical protein
MEESGGGILKVLFQYFSDGAKENPRQVQEELEHVDRNKTGGFMNTMWQY